MEIPDNHPEKEKGIHMFPNIIVGGNGENGTVSVRGKDDTPLAELLARDNEAAIGVGNSNRPGRISIFGADQQEKIRLEGASGKVTGQGGIVGGIDGGPITNQPLIGVHGFGDTAVKGENTAGGTGVYGVSSSGMGVHGFTGKESTGVGGMAVFGEVAAINGAVGVYGQAPMNTASSAGWFDGPVTVTGFLNKPGGGFKIDHPLDPANKYLSHSFVESEDMKNIYDGVAVLDAEGTAVVKLPAWFESLNRDFRYQLTCLGRFCQVYIAEEIANSRFKIAGGERGLKVSWMVTGIRRDPWAEANRLKVEDHKPARERGYYLHPFLYGHGVDKGVIWAYNPEIMKAMQEEKKER
jgi:hypothetical protein